MFPCDYGLLRGTILVYGLMVNDMSRHCVHITLALKSQTAPLSLKKIKTPEGISLDMGY